MESDFLVLNTLLKLSAGETNRQEVNFLIELAYNYSSTYLRFRYKNLNKSLLLEDLSLKEMAIDAIAPLFERDKYGIFSKLKNAFDNWQPKIETEDIAAFFINRLVAKSVEKYVSEILRETDPFFSKILDSINYLIEKNGYKRKIILGIAYIIEENEGHQIGALPTASFIESLPSNLFYPKNNLISQIFNYIRTNSEFTVAIPINALVYKLKKMNINDHTLREDEPADNKVETTLIIKNALEATFIKLNVSYVDKQKLEQNESDIFKTALENIGRDLQDGGIVNGLHKYVMELDSSVTFEVYQHKYQNIFEYLFKQLKKEILNQLKD